MVKQSYMPLAQELFHSYKIKISNVDKIASRDYDVSRASALAYDFYLRQSRDNDNNGVCRSIHVERVSHGISYFAFRSLPPCE